MRKAYSKMVLKEILVSVTWWFMYHTVIRNKNLITPLVQILHFYSCTKLLSPSIPWKIKIQAQTEAPLNTSTGPINPFRGLYREDFRTNFSNFTWPFGPLMSEWRTFSSPRLNSACRTTPEKSPERSFCGKNILFFYLL